MKHRQLVKRHFFAGNYELKAVEEYLEKMAEKGLFLNDITDCEFYFKKGEPKQYKYAISCDSCEQSQEEAGDREDSVWQLLLEKEGMRVYCSKRYNPPPIPMEPNLLLENIHKRKDNSYGINGRFYAILSSIARMNGG